MELRSDLHGVEKAKIEGVTPSSRSVNRRTPHRPTISDVGRKSREKRERRTRPGIGEAAPRQSPIPPGWGADPLSEFLQVAHENAYFVFTQHRRVYDLLRLVHETFDVAVGIASHSRPQYLAFFVTRAFSSYLAGIRLALSGQVAESFAPFRVLIETAWYGLHVSVDPESTKRMEAWLCRDDSEEAKWNVVKMFRSGDLKATHRQRDPETARILEELYERCISTGAHPNPAGFLASIIREEHETALTHKVLLLNAQVLPLMLAIKTAVEIAVGVLRIFGLMYPKQYVDTGMLAKLEHIIDELNIAFKPYVPQSVG